MTLATATVAGGISEVQAAPGASTDPRRERVGVTVASNEAPILDLRYRTLDGARARATHVEREGFQGVTLHAPLTVRIAFAGSAMLLCSEALRTWMNPCPGRVGEGPAIADRGRPTTAELKLIRLLDRGIRAAFLRGPLVVTGTMLYGIEPEPILQFQMKREMLILLATVIQDSRVLSAALAIEPTSSIRAIAEGQTLDRERIRATLVEIASFEVVTERAAPATRVALASAGALLFGSGIFGEKMLHRALGDAFVIHPQPWPLGIQLIGSFGVP